MVCLTLTLLKRNGREELKDSSLLCSIHKTPPYKHWILYFVFIELCYQWCHISNWKVVYYSKSYFNSNSNPSCSTFWTFLIQSTYKYVQQLVWVNVCPINMYEDLINYSQARTDTKACIQLTCIMQTQTLEKLEIDRQCFWSCSRERNMAVLKFHKTCLTLP